MSAQENTTTEETTPKDMEKELKTIENRIANIDYASAEEHHSEIYRFMEYLKNNSPEYQIFFQELYFEAIKLIEAEEVEKEKYSHVNEVGLIVDSENNTKIWPSNFDITDRYAAYLATLKYYTELKNSGGSYEYGNIAPYGERLRNDLKEIVAEQKRKKQEGIEREKVARERYAADIEAHRAIIHREVIKVFTETGLPLNEKLSEMLMEPDNMQRGRQGSGYTNTSRELATYVNNSLRNPLGIFDENAINDSLGEDLDRKITFEEKLEKLGVKEKLNEISKKLTHPSHAIFVNMIRDIIFRSPKDLPEIKIENNQSKLEKAGTCTSAELFYFKWDGIKEFKDFNGGYDGTMNIITDQSGKPLMVEKIGMGEKSCITLETLQMEGVEIPAGSMLQAIPKEDYKSEQTGHQSFSEKATLDQYDGFRFMRISTLALPPDKREEAFGNHYKQQIESDYLNYDWVETHHYKELAEKALQEKVIEI